MTIEHFYSPRRRLIPLLAVFFLCTAPSFATTGNLDLAQEPLFSGTSAPPNVLVAIDDSGSMDIETLFPTNEGRLYWQDSQNAGADSNGNFYDYGIQYQYVFPFDQISEYYGTVPPIPALAYVRSPDFNKAYFNPATDYLPWVDYPASRYQEALFDPNKIDGSIDLTVSHFQQNGPQFDFRKDMMISGDHWERWRESFKQCLPGPDNVDDCIAELGPSELAETIKQSGYKEKDVAGCVSSKQSLKGCLSQLGITYDVPAAQNGRYALLYFPATFYLRENAADAKKRNMPPADFGYKADKTFLGTAPDGNEQLVGYEIRPDNFETPAAYEAAIQNFANWFTYYRKRHLATRGGVAAAFDRIDNVRVGACTINKRRDLITGDTDLTMRDLNDSDQRQAFYSAVFNIDYETSRGTPNREALDYLGEQLERKGNKSIVTASCQRNYALLFTDGYSEPSTTSGVGNADTGYGPPFSDDWGNTIADIAMHYYTSLDTDKEGILRVRPECDEPDADPRLDCNTDLHMTTFGITLNQTGKYFNNRDEYPNQNKDPYSHPPAWENANTGGRSKKQIDDLWHAAINTRGELLDAETPAEIADRFTSALERILGEEGAATGIPLNSSSFIEGATAYQASFIAGAWTGELQARTQAKNGSLSDSVWLASKTLSDPNDEWYTAPNDRIILSNIAAKCGNDKRRIAPFRYDEFRDNGKCGPSSADEVAFLRGHRSGERANGGEFRNRNSNILGDIVHSTPLYVGAPSRIRYPAVWKDQLQNDKVGAAEKAAGSYYSNSGSSFAKGNADRRPMIYVGANDGMLHGFDAETGKERLAFIPGAVLDDIGELTKPSYRHRYYVDGSPASGDVVIKNSWRTVLVGGLGAGGRSIYALDITDPAAFSESNADKTVLWEFNDPELGYTFGKPAIVRLHNGRWAAIFGNGYNSNEGNAQLFVVDIASGSLLTAIDTGAGSGDGNYRCIGDKDDCEEDDEDYVTLCYNGQTIRVEDDDDEDDGDYDSDESGYYLKKGATKGACAGEPANGLSEVFPVDLDGDFITDYVYAGDLYGNMWQFDLTDSNSKKWKVGHGKKPLFKARDENGNAQPITAQPQVAAHPYGDRYGVMVYFGTGKYLESNDRNADADAVNTFYGIQDVDVFTFNNANGGNGSYDTSVKNEIPRDRLQAQTIEQTTLKDGSTYRLVSDNEVNYQTRNDGLDKDTKRGWVLDLPVGEGELVANNAHIIQDKVAFTTTIPNTEMCSASGSGYVMLVDRRTGGRTDYPAFDLNGDRKLNTSDTFVITKDGKQVNIGASGMLIAQGIPGPLSYQVDPSTGGGLITIPDSSGSVTQVYTQNQTDRRRSWREIRR